MAGEVPERERVMQANADGTESPMWRLLQWIVSAAAGALFTLVAFRTRFVLLEQAMKTQKADLEKLEVKIDAQLAAIERRQMMTLQILADVARKVGVDARFSDTLVKFLSDEARGETQP